MPTAAMLAATLIASSATTAAAAEPGGSDEPRATEDVPAPTSAAPLDAPPPRLRLEYQSITAVRYNPLGLLELASLTFRNRLYRSDSAAFRDNYFGIGIAPGFSPAFARVGPILELQPLTILKLWVKYEVVGYYGTFDLLQSFPSPNYDYGDNARERMGDYAEGNERRSYSTAGQQWTFGSNVQIKVGPVAARYFFQAIRGDYELRPGDRTYYDQMYDVLAPNQGWFLTNDVDLLWVTDFGLAAGARYTATIPLYERRHYRPGERDLGRNPDLHRVGPLVAYTLWKDPPGAMVNDPTILLLMNWWLSHRYRTGSEVAVEVPYIAVGFLVHGDLWTSGPG